MEYMQNVLRNTQTNREGTPEATNRRDRGLTVKKPGTGLTARSGGLTVRTIKAVRIWLGKNISTPRSEKKNS
jgi:hypothetical protein